MRPVDREAFGSAQARLRFVVISSLGSEITQRGATQRFLCDQRSCYAPSIWLRLRRAEE